MMAQSKLGDETMGLLKRSLDIFIRNEGLDGRNTAAGNYNIGKCHNQLAGIQSSIDSKRTHLLLAKSYFEEALRVFLKTYGPTNSNTVDATSRLANIKRELLGGNT
jgi:hypothetical protein